MYSGISWPHCLVIICGKDVGDSRGIRLGLGLLWIWVGPPLAIWVPFLEYNMRVWSLMYGYGQITKSTPKFKNVNEMYISGITVQKKKTTLKLTSNSKLPRQQPTTASNPHPAAEQRPYSSEQKLMKLQEHYSIGPSKRREIDIRHLSQNKITVKKVSEKRISNKSIGKVEADREYRDKQKQREKEKEREKQRDSQALSLKPKLNKRPVSDVANTSTARLNPEQMIKIAAYFRYLPVSILTSINLRQQFLRTLSQQLQFKPLNPFKKAPTKKDLTPISDYWLKLNKQAQLKGKYKYREKYNYAYCAQLKALDYKRKEYKKRKEESSSSSDEDKNEKCRDMDTWKKTMGIDGKVFIIKGRYPDLKQALLERGWVENTDKKSTFYDLRWTTKISDINFSILKPNQLVNHFDNNACLTSKYGLIKSIRSVMYPESMDIDRFFPKAYDLSDLGDFENFIEMFKFVYCEALIKRYLGVDGEDCEKVEGEGRVSEPKVQFDLDKIKLAIIVTQRRLAPLETILRSASANSYQFCSINQWNYLLSRPHNPQQLQKSLSTLPATSPQSLPTLASSTLQKLSQSEPQTKLNGHRNIWIVKPAFLSRGRGIKCLDSLTDILDTCLGKDTQYVVQKYIENPLIINRRKFDIRVWVLIEDYQPPRIWFYNQFYLRFCLEDYDTDMLKNRYAHLTNNSVQKYNAKIGATDLDSSMWDRQTFQKYITSKYSESAFKTLLSKMKQIIIATILGTVDQVHGRRGSFQQLGYDMMIDQDLNPWLIEVNSSPAMDYSTPITRRLVKMVMEDIVKIVVDFRGKKKVKSAGEFKLIYGGDGFANRNYRIGDNKGEEEE